MDVNVLGSGLVFYQRNEGSDSIAKTILSLESAEPELLREDAYSQEIEQGRLAQRAWVLQERICSPRILHFGATQIFWQCNRKTWTEDNLGANLSEDMRGVCISGNTISSHGELISHLSEGGKDFGK